MNTTEEMQVEEQMIISGVARIWCEGNTKRGVDCEDRDHCRTYGRPIRPWPLNFQLRPQTPAGASSLDPLETFVLQSPWDCPIILGLRAILYQNAEGVSPKASREMKRGTVYRTRSQSTSGSEEAPSAPLAGLGAPGPKTILLLSETDRMPILDRKLHRVVSRPL